MTFKIATWNVNSLRVRLPHLLQWLETNKPDVVALQETKLIDKDFPHEELLKAGYYSACSGQPTYNGVAILSRLPIIDTDAPQMQDEQKRVLAATITPHPNLPPQGGKELQDNHSIRIIDLYVPNGSAVDSEKYVYKLNWLEKITAYLEQQLKQYPKLLVLGDFNIAPEDRDVHDPKAWEGQVLVSERERAALNKLFSLGLSDIFRQFEQDSGHYTWWDYRMGAFRRNHGLRIDHILLNSNLEKSCTGCFIDKTPRSWERPSDHTPLVVELTF